MARYDRNVRRIGRPVYGRGDRAAGKQKSRFKPRLPAGSLAPLVSLALMIILVVVVNQLTSLNKVSLVGGSASSSERLEKTAKDGLGRQWFGNSLLFVNANALREYMMKNQPIIQDIKIRRKFPHTLELSVSERQPGILWKSGEQVYLLDNEGAVIGEGSGVPAGSGLPQVVDSTHLPVKVGDRVVGRSFVAFCTTLHREMPVVGVKAAEYIVPESSSEVHVKTNKGYLIKFDTTRSAEGELADLKNLYNFLTKNRRVPAEYIDLRIAGKAYYR